jgi:hypothetical protein
MSPFFLCFKAPPRYEEHVLPTHSSSTLPLPGLTAPERDLLGLLQRLERRPRLTLTLLFLVSFCGSLLFVAFKGWPLPSVHDEFSYLLAADTFADGRMSNPPNPFPDHFETFHVLQHPTYASKYPPMQGLVLALGQCLGHPALGVFLASAAAVAAAYWALRALLPHGWSLFGAVLVWAQFAPYSFHSFSYMGGNVSALGAFLLFGAAIRIVLSEKPDAWHSQVMGVAVLVLAASRPFEGMLVCCGIGLLLGWKFLTAAPALKRAWLISVVVPGAAILVAGASLLLAYNRVVTGDAFTLPYSVYEASHSRTPLFVWGSMRDNPLPSTPHMERFEKEFTEKGFLNETAKGFVWRFGERLEILRDSFIPFWFPATILLLLSVWPSERWSRFSWLLILGFMTACSFTVWFSRYYLGCLLPFLCLLACLGARRLSLFRWHGAPWGLQLFRASLWMLLLLQLFLLVAAPAARERTGAFAAHRMEIEDSLRALPGDDLVFVTYTPEASVHEEWVYNHADIDRTPVVWVHSLGAAEDEKLMRYFSDRRIWRLEVGEKQAGPLVEVFPGKG